MADYRIFYVPTYSGGNTVSGQAAAQFAIGPNGNNIVNPALTYFNSQVQAGVNPDNVFLNEKGLTVANYNSSAYQLYDVNGQRLAQQNPNAYYVAPLDYSVFDPINAAKGLTQAGLDPVSALFVYNAPNFGPGDLQRNYDGGQYGRDFVKSFTDIGGFNYGINAAALGLSLNDALYYAGAG